MIIKDLAVGPIMTNCYLIGCEQTQQGAVIDPGDDVDLILMELAALKLKVKYIINTHGHFDHVGGNKRMKEVTAAPILIHAADAPMLAQLSQAATAFGLSSENSPPADRFLEEGDTIEVGNITLKTLHTPGHTPGGISFYTEGVVFVGDTLFNASIGRTDFPGGNYETLIKSIQNKLFKLTDQTKVLSGHGPATTIEREKKTNPFARLG